MYKYTPRRNVIILKALRWIMRRMLSLTGWTLDSNKNTSADIYGHDAIDEINTLIELSGGKP